MIRWYADFRGEGPGTTPGGEMAVCVLVGFLGVVIAGLSRSGLRFS